MNALAEAPYVCKLERIPPDVRCELIFRLIYDGPLPTEQRGKPLAPVKSDIRRQFSPQLQELWRTHKELSVLVNSDNHRTLAAKGYAHHVGVPAIARAYAFGDCQFVPLVRKMNGMLCKLDISVLMRQAPFHTTFREGDLDNRIKTLIDGLTKPNQPGQHIGPSGEMLYCLLEDDGLIAEFTVRSDQLLAPRRDDRVERDVVALITVEVLNTAQNVVTVGGSSFGLVKER